MLIKIATILQKNCELAMEVAKKLDVAVQDGEMLKVDSLSEKLESLTDKDNSISIAEDYWHRFIFSIRDVKADYGTSYLLDGIRLQEILNLGLQEFQDITAFFEKAVETDSLVLQLPIEEVD